jgi:hypothetical protein
MDCQVNVAGFLYPIASLDQIIDALERTNLALLRLGHSRAFLNSAAAVERHRRLLWLRDRLEFQRDRMVEQGATVSGEEAA